jgi:hypothetical protein
MAGETMALISKVTLASLTSSITFSSIPQQFTDLQILCSSRENTITGYYGLANFLRFNGSTSSYSRKSLYGNGSSAASSNNGSQVDIMITGSDAGGATTANVFNNLSIYIPNYASANNKFVSVDSVWENNSSSAEQFFTAGLWANTAAITSITLYSQVNWDPYSTFYLYGILKGSGGATVS